MSYGRYFEELEAGQVFRHWPGRTITEFDDTLFSLMSMNQHPVHIDEHYAAGTQHGQRLVEGPLVISLVIGMSQADIGGRATRTLEYSDVRHLSPVFHGDTIYAESTILSKEVTGIVTIESRGVNQRGEPILTLRRKILVPQSEHPMHNLTAEQQLILTTVRHFVEKEVIPVASDLEHRNEYPHDLVVQMQKIGLFGLNVPERYGGAEVDTTTFAMIFEELSRGWLGLAGVIGTHSVLCDVLNHSGTEEQKQQFLPGLATGERRGGICLSESNAGTDLQNISTVATRRGNCYIVNGSKMWITNARYGNTFLLLAKTNPQAKPRHSGMSAFVIEKGASGLTVSRDIDKLGYKSVETCELHFQDFAVPAENLIGGVEGEGFKQVMTGLEAERLNVAARGLGIARAAFEEAIRYAQRRTTFGKPICEHQTIQIKLADMATKIEASRLLIYSAAEKRDHGERCDLEAGMAKLFATEAAAEVSFEAMRILGGNGYSKDFPVERYYRDAPLVVIGGGTNELQRLIIARRLIEKYRQDKH